MRDVASSTTDLVSMHVEESFSHTICGVCSKPYNDPRILPCLHSFCQQCLHHEIEKYGSQQVFKCPTCERKISVPVGGASAIHRNLHLGFEVEVAGYMSKIASNSEVCCDHCIDGSSGPAVVFCCTCRQFLCQLCHDHHKRGRQLSTHNMVGVDQEGAKQLQATMKQRDNQCSQPNHEDNKLDLYCETCKCLIQVCRDSTTGTHMCKYHDVTELSTVAKTHQLEIKGAVGDANEIVAKLTSALVENNAVIEQMEVSKISALLAVNKAFEVLQQTLKERKKTLLSEVEAISLSKTTALTLQKEQFEKIVEDIGHYTEMASHILQTHTDHEVVALGGLIPTELKAIFKRVQSMSLTPNQHSDISVSVQTDGLVTKLSKFGYVSELSPSSSTWTSTSVAKVGTRFHVKVESKTSKREGYPHGGVQVKGEMRYKSHSGPVVYGEVEDHRDGTYTITLTPQTAGQHELHITMDGQHVANSPHDLYVDTEYMRSNNEEVRLDGEMVTEGKIDYLPEVTGYSSASTSRFVKERTKDHLQEPAICCEEPIEAIGYSSASTSRFLLETTSATPEWNLQVDKTPQMKTNRTPQADRTPQTDWNPQTNRTPQTDMYRNPPEDGYV